QGGNILEPFCRSLGHAVQWYDMLQVEIERNVEDILQECQNITASARSHVEALPLLPPPVLPTKHDLLPGACAPTLIQHCPACFGGQHFGHHLDNGGDIRVAMDSNFHHCHWHSPGDCPPFYDPIYFLPKSQVDDIG
ncbi:hypothetical protein EDD17DRAFT_1489349, partial [Pisolithus thermaeus]